MTTAPLTSRGHGSIEEGPAGDVSPNVIWVVADQHRAQAVGFAGDPNVSTPNLDRLAGEGAVFSAVAGSPLCTPFRAAMLSSRYPHESAPGHEHQMPPELPTVATAFKAAGYRTAFFGKWHVDGFHERDGRAALHVVPPERRGGFDDWLGYENNNSQWDCWLHGSVDGDEVQPYRLPGYEADALTDVLIDRIVTRAADRQPFFAVLSMQPPHDPYVAPAEWMERHSPSAVELRSNVPAVPAVVERARRDLAGYYAMIENIDWNLGRLRDALERAGIARNTYLVYFSDHGDLHGSHGQFRKTSPYEEAIRIPFVIGGAVPNYPVAPGRSAVPLNHVDIAPTTLGLCGVDVPEWMAGRDLSGLCLRNRPAPEPPESALLQLCVPTGHGDSVNRPWRGVVTADGWKYACLEGQPWMLHDLNEDPFEMANHAFNNRYRAERSRLHGMLSAWLDATGDRFALPEV